MYYQNKSYIYMIILIADVLINSCVTPLNANKIFFNKRNALQKENEKWNI